MTENDQGINASEELQYLQNVIDSTDKQISVLSKGADDYLRALSVLEEANIERATEVRVSLGGGVFVKAKIENSKPLIIPIGSGVFIEEMPEQTKGRLRTSIQEISSTVENLNAQRKIAVSRYEGIISMMREESNRKE
ncbi:MAG: prefoldin subunit alpha [Thermoplasmataceae archaeon]